MSQRELIELFQQLSEKLPNESFEDSAYQQRIVEIIESLEQQALEQSTKLDYSNINVVVSQLLSEYQQQHPKSAAILAAIRNALSNFM